jgi:CspA family cold shock protein
MPSQFQTVTCLRCGRAFASSSTYLQFLARRGANVVVPTQCPACFIKSGPLPKQQGQIKWYSPRKRYGFIAMEEGQEAFFHEKQILGENGVKPQEGQTVRFHLHYPIKGPEALNVELIGE